MKKIILVCILFLLIPFFACAKTESYNVVDVTSKNKDGSSRQAILSKAYEKGAKHSGSLLRYLKNGKPAIYVLLDGKTIGNIPEENVSELFPLADKVDKVFITIGYFASSHGEPVYYAQATVPLPSIASQKSTISLTSSNQSSVSDSAKNEINLIIGVVILCFVFFVASWIYVKINPWQHKVLSGFVVLILWSLVRQIILDIFNIKQLGFITFLISYLPFVWIGKHHYLRLIDKPIRDKQKITSKHSPLKYTSKRAQENASRVLSICSGLIAKFEEDIFGVPSCKEDLLESISLQLIRSSHELETWHDYDTDYLKIAYVMIANHAFDLLACGKYHLATGYISPVSQGKSLLHVYKKIMEEGVQRRYLTEEEMKTQYDLLCDRISKAG